MKIPKNIANIISTVSLFGMPFGFYGSCAYVDLELKGLDQTSPTYEKDRKELGLARNLLSPSLFGLFLTGYIAGNIAFNRRIKEEDEHRIETCRGYSLMDEYHKKSFRAQILMEQGKDGLEYFLSEVEKWERKNS